MSEQQNHIYMVDWDLPGITLEQLAGAQQTAARIRFIEDSALLDGVGGCAAILRFKL